MFVAQSEIFDTFWLLSFSTLRNIIENCQKFVKFAQIILILNENYKIGK